VRPFFASWLVYCLVLLVSSAAVPAPPTKLGSSAQPQLAAASVSRRLPVLLGSEVLAGDGFRQLQGKRVGLLTNPSGVNRHGKSTSQLLRRARGVRLVALFAPEHGLSASFTAGQEFPNATDQATGLPVYSLYGPGPIRKPTAAMLRGLDALIYDLQDVGCRSYTFISTMGLAMEACGEAGVEFWVLDRPNPLGGERVEGPLLEPRFRSLVGEWEIPYVYGMTCGELARMINREGWIKQPCKLNIIRMQGWRRDMVWHDTGLPWVATSPYIRTGDSPLHYVSTGMLGTIGGVNIGLDLQMPFECVAAPWLSGPELAKQLGRYGLRGIRYRLFATRHDKFLQQGIRLEFTDPARSPLTAFNFYALEAIRRSTGRDLFAEAVRSGRDFTMFDKVNGTDATRKALLARRSAESIVNSWKPGEEAFRKKREKYLLY
jgi:uncharacterized protein YbbC (DUF1343 family)